MKPAIKQKWLSALRSGMYKQCDGFLAVPAGEKGTSAKPEFCVLGVLAEISGVPRELDEEEGCYKFKFGKTSRSESTGFPSADFAKKVGMSPSTMSKLYERNDSGESFKELADYIEENL